MNFLGFGIGAVASAVKATSAKKAIERDQASAPVSARVNAGALTSRPAFDDVDIPEHEIHMGDVRGAKVSAALKRNKERWGYDMPVQQNRSGAMARYGRRISASHWSDVDWEGMDKFEAARNDIRHGGGFDPDDFWAYRASYSGKRSLTRARPPRPPPTTWLRLPSHDHGVSPLHHALSQRA